MDYTLRAKPERSGLSGRVRSQVVRFGPTDGHHLESHPRRRSYFDRRIHAEAIFLYQLSIMHPVPFPATVTLQPQHGVVIVQLVVRAAPARTAVAKGHVGNAVLIQ